MLSENNVKNNTRYYFVTDYSEYVEYSGTYVTIIRPLKDGAEIDKEDVGPMWLAKADNGFELNVYLDELYLNEELYEEYIKG